MQRSFSIFVLVLALAGGRPAHAKVFHSKQGALELAFPGADSVEAKHFFLDKAQLDRIAARAGERPRSKLLTGYVGRKAGKVLGYAFIDTHIVRTLPETFMVVLDPKGMVQAVHLLAFHEPLEYMPRAGWLGQFRGKALTRELRVRGQIAGIAGATLSANAVTRATRRVLATFSVLELGPAVGGSARATTGKR